MARVHFSRVTARQVTGAPKATGATDPDIPGAAPIAPAASLVASSVLLGLAALIGFGSPVHAQAPPLPESFRGDWVPASGDCASPTRLRVTGEQLTLINGNDGQSFGDLWIAASWFGHDYTGISQVVVPERSRQDHPFTVTFNADEQPDVTRVDIHFEPQGAVNPAMQPALETSRRLAARFPIDHVPLKKCDGTGGTGDIVGSATGSGITCTDARCAEVSTFTATVTDFRISGVNNRMIANVTVRFRNRTERSLILAYVQGSGLVTDDQGNRYVVGGVNGVRGMGQITGRVVDPQFVLRPGEASAARFELLWAGRSDQIRGTVFDLDLAVREIDPLPGSQYEIGREHALAVRGLTNAPISVGNPPQGVSAAAPGGVTRLPGAGTDACADREHCYHAGPFRAEVRQVSVRSDPGPPATRTETDSRCSIPGAA